MTEVYVVSCKGNLINIIHRKHFKKPKYDNWVPYKGKKYKVYDRRKTNLNGYAIYPYGVTCKKRK